MKRFFAIILAIALTGWLAYAGTNTLSAVVEGDVIEVSTFNQYREALIGSEVVPRNSSGVPQDNVSDIGSTTYRWKVGYFVKVILGAIASGISIEDNSGDVEFNVASGGEYAFEINNSEVARIDASGITRSSFPTTGVLRDLKYQDFVNSNTFVVPSNVDAVFIWGVGAGGGGGGGGGAGGSGGGDGGGGGAGADPRLDSLAVDGGETLTITIGTGGTAGAGVTNSSGTSGGGGADSSVAGNNGTITFRGANGGAGGGYNAARAPGAGGASGRSRGVDYNGGGAGGTKQTPEYAGSSGVSGFYAAGGSNGGLPGGGTGNGGDGGGGGAGMGAGGAGGSGGSSVPGAGSSPLSTSYGAGGGGGGGAGTGVSTGGNGGSGQSGFVRIYYVE